MSDDGAGAGPPAKAVRRFTDREVSQVLRRAVEIDEAEGAGGGRGLSLADLEEIAREVGVAPESVARAVRELDTRRPLPSGLGGAPLVRKAVRGVPGRLDREDVARLVGLIDERADSAGAVSEALGSVRWTASDRMRSSFVSITPEASETSIQVVEKARPRIRGIFHGLPTAWALIIAGPLIAEAGLSAGTTVGAIVAAAAAGAGIGRLAWNLLSGASARRVERLADDLAERAAEASPPSPREPREA